MSTSNIAPITFNGSSTYSSSFQQVITRAVSIASLPEQSLQNDVTNLQSQQSALATLDGNFSALQTALQSVATAATGTPTAQVSDPSAVSATASSDSLPGTYQIQVNDVGSSTVALSSNDLATVTDPTTGNISSASSFTLTVNGTVSTITPSGNTLEDLVSAINSAADGVQATIVNVGSNTSPDYRLSVTSDNLGPDTIQLSDNTSNLLDTLSAGTDAQYQVNGSSSVIQSTSSQVTLSPGLSINLLEQSSSPVTVTVSNSLSGLSSALQNFASAYNSVVTALQQNRGQNGGALTGDSLIYSLTDILDQISQYSSGSGSVSTLADLGLSVDDTGQLNFDPTTFTAASTTDIESFLGDINSSGFLQTANNDLTSILDPTSGLIATDNNSMQDQITSDNNQISDDQTRISNLQTSLEAQLSQADAAIATLQSQDTYFTELFTAEYGSPTGQGTTG